MMHLRQHAGISEATQRTRLSSRASDTLITSLQPTILAALITNSSTTIGQRKSHENVSKGRTSLLRFRFYNRSTSHSP